MYQRIRRIARLIARTITIVFLSYAVLFSVATTVAIIYGAVLVYRPVARVKSLVNTNPAETLYMEAARRSLDSTANTDTLAHIFVPLDSISPHLKRAVLAAEDDGFYTHPGIDLNAIMHALQHNSTHTGAQHGASTITQQMAKNLFVGGEKTYLRKAHELIYSLLMEHYLGKDRILELYLNYAQWGKSIFGCEAAAHHYYGRSCAHLSLEQASRLAAILAMPSRLSPHYTQSGFMNKRMRVIANNLHTRKYIDDSTRSELSGTAPDSSPPESAVLDSLSPREADQEEETVEDSANRRNRLSF